jgi:acyl-CoA thioesterase I
LNKSLGLYGALLLVLQGVSGCSAPEPSTKSEQQPTNAVSTPAEAPSKYLIVAYGDSLYAGYRLGPKEGFAPQLEAALRKKGIAARVHPAGVSGDTTEAGKARLSFLLNGLERNPDLFVLGLGGNDMLRGISPEQTRANLTAILDELRKRKIKVVMTGILASPNMGPDYAAEFNPIFPALAKDYHAPFYPFFLEGIAAQPGMMLDDGIHPNAKGVARAVHGIEPLVSGALERVKGIEPSS